MPIPESSPKLEDEMKRFGASGAMYPQRQAEESQMSRTGVALSVVPYEDEPKGDADGVVESLLAAYVPVLTVIALALLGGTAATPVAAQPPEELPDFVAPDLPHGVERLCGGPIVPDLPPGELQAVASASGELPPLPVWCAGACTIDIAFFYDPYAVGQTRADVFGPDTVNPNEPWGPQTIGELKARASAGIGHANVAFRRAGLDAELRFVGMERDPGLSGLDLSESNSHVRAERLTHAREKYGADLVYAIAGGKQRICGFAFLRPPGLGREAAARFAVGSVWVPCLDGTTLAHEVGHNLGLVHHPGITTFDPFVPFGHGYEGQTKFGSHHNTIMHGHGASTANFSTPELLHGRILGNADVSDATRALRYTIPDAVRYSPTVVAKKNEDPQGFGCRPSRSRACLSERRFDVSARYSTQSVSRAPAKRLEALGLGDSGALFYFFGADNPEMLLKVVNGCWLNDHWWVFGSAATDLVYAVAIDDLAEGGGTVEYRHNGGGVIVADNGYSTGSGVISDTRAFPCGQSAAALASEQRPDDGPVAVVPAPEYAAAARVASAGQETGNTIDYGCLPNSLASCLNNWRFSVRANRRSSGGTAGCRPEVAFCLYAAGRLEAYGLGDSGALFYFFGRDNPEMLVKVVKGCAINGHWWVFGSAATDLEYNVYVGDYATASVDDEGRFSRASDNVYRHRGGGRITGEQWRRGDRRSHYSTRSGVIADTTAFPCNQ